MGGGGGVTGARAGAAAEGAEAGARGGAYLCSIEGPVRGWACRGGEEGEARSAVLYRGSLTVPRAEAAGTRGRGSLGLMLGTGMCAHPTLLVHRLRAVPGPCRRGLRTRHPARG